MRFEHYMALRYLRAARGQAEGRGFLRFITYVAIGGVALGVGALLLSLSIVRGFSREIQDKIIGFGAHVQVENYRDAPLEGAPELERELAGFPEVRSVAPVVQDFVLLRRSSRDIDGAVIWGTDALPSYLQQHIVAGRASFQPDSAGHAGIVVGRDLANVLGVSVGDVITAFSMRSREREGGEGGSLPGRPRVAQYHIAGIYETSLQNFDELYVFTSIGEARHLLDYQPNEVTRFDLTIADPQRSEKIAEVIQDSLGFPVLARSIFDVWRGIFAWVHLQQSVIPLVIAVIVLVAAFNIVGTLLMIILEKTREIGVLESMGAAPKALRRLFLWLGLLIGTIGTVVGESIALVLALLQEQYAIIPLPAEAYYMKTAPIELHALDFVVVAVVAVVLCVLASYIPARVASRIDPIKSIRFR
ncbi:MAG TPA: ABC transporter permease [Rhodothermales bacterium]|nr:ABC transporter permease [Rhodothermales bacterium]